ncbi:MAG TPA: cation:proton antiporter [Methylomirabilota bacterium]|nr:cation:proton antiporter [Methylomirabilota bacterium]
MTADPVFFRDLALVLVAAVLGGALAWFARQPLVLGYVLGGMAVSPFTPGPAIADAGHHFEVFAEIGVVLLMFSVGIEFSLKDLMRVKWVALVGGPLGTTLNILLAVAVGALLGWPLPQAIVVGAVISVASTMVLARLLLDRGELHTRHGRVLVGISLVEDLAAVVLMALMPALGALAPDRVLAIARGLGVAALVLVPFLAVAGRVVPMLLTRVARTRDQELFLLVALAIGLGTAALTQAVGLSLALGAFLAGLLISTSDFAHETLARLLPLRDTFGAFFFVTVGALIDPARLLANVPLLVTMVLLVVVGKLVLRAGVVRLFGEPPATALLTGVGLAQIGEFSFVLVQAARQEGHVGDDVYQATLAASLLSIVLNAALVRLAPRVIGALRPAAPPAVPATGGELQGHVLLCGYGRVGSAVAEALETFGVRYVAIENDPDVVRSLRERGIAALFGDASQRRLLHEAGAEHAALAVVALPEMERVRLAVRALRELNPRLAILARTHERAHHEDLRQAGATEVIQPELEAASTLIRHALRRLALPRERVLAYLEHYRDAVELMRGESGPTSERLPQLRDVTLPDGALADRSLRDARVRERFGVSVMAVTGADGSLVLHPSADTVLRRGDRLTLFGLPEQLDALLAHAGATPRQRDGRR